MSVVFLIFVIGVLNVCLGYVLAVRLGYGPPGLLEAWDALSAEPQGPQEATLGASVETLVAELAATPIDQMLDDEPDEEMEDELEVENYEEPDDDVGDLLDPDAPETWDLNEKYVETSILKLNIAMMKSGAKATELDTRLRECKGNSDEDTILRCLTELKEDCKSYLAEQTELAEKFRERIDELGELSELGDEIEIANLEQSAQIETTLSNLEHMDFESDLEAANHRLLEEIHNLRVVRHKLRDNQDVAFLEVARYQNRLDSIEARLYNDPLTDLRNRIGIETTLFSWWKQGRHQSRQISAALFDVDNFDQLNEDHGSLAADRILRHVAELIREKAGKVDLAGRFAGQQFLLMMLDVGPRAATKNAETIRQTIERTTFAFKEQQICITVRGGYTEVSPEDTYQSVMARLEETLDKAKEAGPNQAFFHDRKEATLVESPDFGAERPEIQI